MMFGLGLRSALALPLTVARDACVTAGLNFHVACDVHSRSSVIVTVAIWLSTTALLSNRLSRVISYRPSTALSSTRRSIILLASVARRKVCFRVTTCLFPRVMVTRGTRVDSYRQHRCVGWPRLWLSVTNTMCFSLLSCTLISKRLPMLFTLFRC